MHKTIVNTSIFLQQSYTQSNCFSWFPKPEECKDKGPTFLARAWCVRVEKKGIPDSNVVSRSMRADRIEETGLFSNQETLESSDNG